MSGVNALNIAKDALFSHQTAINLTGTNIANANTEGYTRQRPIFNNLDQSVEIGKIERVYDKFLENQINEQMHHLGYGEAKRDELSRIEMIFNEADGGGINEALNQFWSAWEDLSANPAGQAEKQALVSISQSLTAMFRSYSNEIISIQDNVNAQIPYLVDEVNNHASDIADINTSIIKAGKNAVNETGINSLKDQRANLLSDMARVIDFHYIENSDDSISVFLSNGMPLVEGEQVWELDVVTENHSSNPSFYDVILKDDADKEVINSIINNGSLAGFLGVRDTVAQSYLERLNTIASTLVTQINAQHKLGYDMNKNLGGDFFDSTKTLAKNIEVSSVILSDINKIAVSETVNGDGGNASRLGSIKDELLMDNGHSTINNYYASIVGSIGQDVEDVNRDFDRQTSLMTQLANRKEGVSGVSIDEEMMNLIRFQTGYNAAAKFFSTSDELINTLMNLVN